MQPRQIPEGSVVILPETTFNGTRHIPIISAKAMKASFKKMKGGFNGEEQAFNMGWLAALDSVKTEVINRQ